MAGEICIVLSSARLKHCIQMAILKKRVDRSKSEEQNICIVVSCQAAGAVKSADYFGDNSAPFHCHIIFHGG